MVEVLSDSKLLGAITGGVACICGYRDVLGWGVLTRETDFFGNKASVECKRFCCDSGIAGGSPSVCISLWYIVGNVRYGCQHQENSTPKSSAFSLPFIKIDFKN